MSKEIIGKIVQIVPANDIYAIFKNDAGVKFKRKIDLFGLDEFGNFYCLIINKEGYLKPADKASNFVKYEKENE